MSLHVFSVSEAHRVKCCPPSAALPGVREDSIYSERGTDIHSAIILAARGEEVGEFEPIVTGIRESGIDLSTLRHDVAMAWDVVADRVRLIGHGLGRAYGDTTRQEIPGTADAIGLTPDEVIVIDWKSGRTADREQLLLYAAMACRLYGRDRARGFFVWLDDEGVRGVTPYTFDAFDFAGLATVLRNTLNRVWASIALLNGGKYTPSVSMGRHCRFCPAMDACPGYTRMAVEIARQPNSLEERLAAMTPDEWGRADMLVTAGLTALHRVRTRLDQMAEAEPRRRHDGQMYGLVPGIVRETVVDAQRVYRELNDRYTLGVAEAAVEMKSSKASIERALKGRRGEAKKTIDYLRAAGAIVAKRGKDRLAEYAPALPGRNPEGVKVEEYGEKFVEAVEREVGQEG